MKVCKCTCHADGDGGFVQSCKKGLVHSKMSSLGDAKCNAIYADWLTVHFSCDCLSQSLIGTIPLATAYCSLSLPLHCHDFSYNCLFRSLMVSHCLSLAHFLNTEIISSLLSSLRGIAVMILLFLHTHLDSSQSLSSLCSSIRSCQMVKQGCEH